MSDRFLDDTKIKKRTNPKLQATLAAAKQLHNRVQEKMNSMPPEELSQLVDRPPTNMQEVAQQIQTNLNIPDIVQNTPSIHSKDIEATTNIPFNQQVTLEQLPDNSKISHSLAVSSTIIPENMINTNQMSNNDDSANSLNNNSINQYITNYVRNTPDISANTELNNDISNNNTPQPIANESMNKHMAEQRYNQEVYNILQQHPELAPNNKPALNINVQADMQGPNYIVTRENGKVKAETKQFREMNKKIGPLKLDRNILLEKQREADVALESARIELEIYSKMLAASNDDSLRLNIKFADWQKKVKEAELRQTAIANILVGK